MIAKIVIYEVSGDTPRDTPLRDTPTAAYFREDEKKVAQGLFREEGFSGGGLRVCIDRLGWLLIPTRRGVGGFGQSSHSRTIAILRREAVLGD